MRVFVSPKLPEDLQESIARVAEVVRPRGEEGLLGDAFLDAAATLDGILTLLSDEVDAALLARAPRLKIVANAAVGFDNVDLEACRARGIAVTNTPGVLTESTADLAFALLLAAARRVAEGDRFVRAGRFQGFHPGLMVGAKVHGATLGVVGLGRIGQAVARRARGFGMHVLYTQRARLDTALERALGATFVPLDALDALLAQSDFVSLHCPLMPETRHLLSAERLRRMKPGAVLINTGRGAVIDEAALVRVLRDGPLAAAGLDVFEHEPTIEPALMELENVVLTPHVGSADAPTRRAIGAKAVENLLAELAGSRAPDRVV